MANIAVLWNEYVINIQYTFYNFFLSFFLTANIALIYFIII